MKYIHITDTHLDHLFPQTNGLTKEQLMKQHVALVESFISRLTSENEVQNYFLTGDISSGELIGSHLRMLAEGFLKKGKRLFFILGNHDYYGSSFASVEQEVKNLAADKKYKKTLFYVNSKSWFDKTEQVLVAGSNGWYDGEYSPFTYNSVEMNDYYLIKELKEIRLKSRDELFLKNKDLSKNYVASLVQDIEFGILGYNPKNIAVLTHVPVFMELSTYKGKISDDVWMPCFSSKFMGDALLNLANKYQEINFHVFCGHSHGEANYSPLPNLSCRTGKARYGTPEESIYKGEIC